MNLCGCVFLWGVCVCFERFPICFFFFCRRKCSVSFLPSILISLGYIVFDVIALNGCWSSSPLHLLSRHPDRGWETKAVSLSFSSGEYQVFMPFQFTCSWLEYSHMATQNYKVVEMQHWVHLTGLHQQCTLQNRLVL